MATNILSGIGAERDSALRGGVRQNTKNVNEGVEQELTLIPLSRDVQQAEIVQGDLCSIKGGYVVPLDAALPFGGIVKAVGEDRGRYVCSLLTRAAVVVRVRGLSHETRQGEKVYARRGLKTESFSLNAEGTEIGEFIAVENLERERATVGIRVPSDSRRFEMGGDRASGRTGR